MPALDPGWYRDPHDNRRHRYWDGERWLDQCERLCREDRTGPDDDERG